MQRGILLISAVFAAWLSSLASQTLAATEPFFVHEAVRLRNHNGTAAAGVGTNLPYSPKQTCGLANCHDSPSFFIYDIDNFYESHWALSQKTQWSRENGTGNRDGIAYTYEVPYPQHAVSAGYHFQQGRNVSWDAARMDFYNQYEFTSSSGMYGRFCPPTNLQLVAPAETDPATWGHGSYKYRISNCSWCHPGGGPLEYDRNGYRYDGRYSPYALLSGGTYGFVSSGINPNADSLYGDYYIFDPNAAASEPPFLVSMVNETARGVTEIDCLMCHLNAPYNIASRNYCMTEEGVTAPNVAPIKAATMGLTLTGELTPLDSNGDGIATSTGAPGVNPDCNFVYEDTTGAASRGFINDGLIVKTPKKENCALCHFADNNIIKGYGPGDAPLDWSTFQKYIGPNTFIDSDTNAPNTNAYYLAKGRTEFEKRGESINDPNNIDIHMDKLVCADCHYTVSGDIEPLVDQYNNTIQPGLIGVKKIDHQFAKGNNRVDGVDMDQFDNTVTCMACHITGDHPAIVKSGGLSVTNPDGTFNFVTRYVENPGTCEDLLLGDSIPDTCVGGTNEGLGCSADLNCAENLGADGFWNTGDEASIILPVPTHAAFPVLHFDEIDCRTCHIPKLNFVKKNLALDYSTTPYPEAGVERGQNIYKEVGGVPQPIEYQPFYMWLNREHNGTQYKLTPVTISSIFMWKDIDTGLPYPKRFPVAASKAYRDGFNPGFLINSPQGAPADEALIANTTSEVAGMVNALQSLGDELRINNPALNIFTNPYTFSHNVAPKRSALGGPENGGCADCHSAESKIFLDRPEESDPNKPCFGQPQGCKGLVFFPPQDGGVGLEMTCDGGDCATGAKRITNEVIFPCPDGSTRIVDLTEGVAHGAAINNVLPQSDILCYSATQIGMLTRAQVSAYFVNLDADIKVAYDSAISFKVNFDAALSKCPSVLRGEGDICAYDWLFGDGNVGSGKLVSNTYADTDNYTVSLTVTDPLTGYSDSQTTTVTPRIVVPRDVAINISSAGNVGTVTVTAPDTVTVNYVYINWGDGAKSSDSTIFTGVMSYDHTYTAPGTYIVYAKARNSSNVWVADKQYVTIP